MRLPDHIIKGLSPGVRELVVWLNAWGFETVDSGDGSNYAAGMEGAMDCPMVAIVASPDDLVQDAVDLMDLLRDRGVKFGPEEGQPRIQAIFDPADGSAVIVLTDVLSADVEMR